MFTGGAICSIHGIRHMPYSPAPRSPIPCQIAILRVTTGCKARSSVVCLGTGRLGDLLAHYLQTVTHRGSLPRSEFLARASHQAISYGNQRLEGVFR